MKFSVCIPNFNYANYLDKTLDSVLANKSAEYEVVVADNASTDTSVELVKRYAALHGNIRLKVNSCNVGFAGNLDRVGEMAAGDYMIMLSSDDLMGPETLQQYGEVFAMYPDVLIGSACDRIDSQGNKIGYTGPHPDLWLKEDIDQQLSSKFGCPVYRCSSDVLLRRCLLTMQTPFGFCTGAYPRRLYDAVGGYGGGRSMNPDKWFHWKLMTECREVVYFDKPLFSYRWHSQNQVGLESSFGHLRFLMDEYKNAIEVTQSMLSRSGMSRSQVEKSFVRRDIYRHGIGEFSKGRWFKSFRIFFFGLSVFPIRHLLNLYSIPYFLLLCSTPVGSWLVAGILKRMK
ncbi:MAG TPA: glycosyltransferase family 2 protein [Cyclobacteriaceae bacterium]|nr:glycosyltransferase family 2 protein [Cyclobacteriaceae bacterium]